VGGGGPPAHALSLAAAGGGVLLADLSGMSLPGMSKGEVQRIWLSLVIWWVPRCARLPRGRAWSLARPVLALAVNHPPPLTVW